MVNRDLQAVKAAISQQNTMQKRMEKMQMRSFYANNTAESLIKSAKKAGYTVPASAYQPVQQTPQQSGGITADSLMKEYQQWLSEQSNQTAQNTTELSSGGASGTGYRQYLQNNQQIPSLNGDPNDMSNDDIAKQINIANMVKDQKAQTQEEQDKNVADILSKLNSDSSMADKARQLLNKRNTDYTSQTGKTDYNEAVQRTLQNAIPSLADNQPQTTENAKKTEQTSAHGYSNEAIAKIMADAGGGDEKALLDQLNNDPELAKKAQSVLNQRDSDYAALTEKKAETQQPAQQTTQRTSKQVKQAQSAYKQAQIATQTAKKKLETEQKKIDQNSQKLRSLQNSLAKAKKIARKTEHYEQVNAIQQQIRGLLDTSADNKAFKKATEEYNKAKFNERAAKLKWANQALENPVAKSGKVLNVTAKPNNDQTLSTAQNLVSAAQNGKLTKSQKSEAKTLAKHYENKIREATLKGQSISDDEMNTYTALKNATSAGASFMSGLANAFSTTKRMAQGVGNAIGKLTGEDNAGDKLSQKLQTTQNTAKKQNGIANVAGTMAGKGAQYALFNQLANAAGLTPAISNTINEKVGLNTANIANTAKGVAGKKLTEQLADVIVGQAADTAFDTIPTIMDNASAGKYDGDAVRLFSDVSTNQMNNLAMNMGTNTIQSGVIPSISDALNNLLGKGQTAEDAISNIAKNAGLNVNTADLKYQSSEDAAEEARRMLSDELARQSDELARQRVAVQSPEDADKEASDILSQYMAEKGKVQNGINGFINKAQNANYSDEEIGSIVDAARQNQVESGTKKLSDAINKRAVTADSLDKLATYFPDRYRNQQKLTANDDDIRNAVERIKQARPDLSDDVDSLVKEAFPDFELDKNASKIYKDVPDSGLSGDVDNVLGDYQPRQKLTKSGRAKGSDAYDVNTSVASLAKHIDNYEKKYGVADDTVKGYLDKAKSSVNDISDAIVNGKPGLAEEASDNYRQALKDLSDYSKKNVEGFDPKDLNGRAYSASANNILGYQSRRSSYSKADLMGDADEAVTQAPKNDKIPSIKDSSDWNPNKRISEILGRDVTMASDMDVPKDDIITSKVPSDTKPVSKSAKKEEIPSISINDAAKDNTNVDELNKRGQNAFDQLVNDVKKSDSSSEKIPDLSDEVYTSKGMMKSLNPEYAEHKRPKREDALKEAEAAKKTVSPGEAVKRMEDRMANRPDKKDNVGYISHGYTNSVRKSGFATDEQYMKGLEEQTRHFTVSEKESFEKGKVIYDSNPEAFIKKYSASMNKEQLRQLDSSDIDGMWIAFGKLNQMSEDATDPAVAGDFRRKASNIAKNIANSQSYNAQILQKNAKYAHTTTGAIMQADGVVHVLRDNALTPKQHNQIDDASQKISEMLKEMMDGKMNIESRDQLAWQEVKRTLDGYSQLKGKFTDKQIKNMTDSVMKDKDWNGFQDLLEMEMTGYSGISTEALDKASNLFDEAQKYNYNSRKYMDLEQEAYDVLAKDIQSQPGFKGASFGKKLDAWRYLMMLGNPKTVIKNRAGNNAFGGITELKDNVAAIIENASDKAIKANGDERTKAILNPLSKDDKTLIEAARAYGEDNAARALSGNKYTNSGQALNNSISTFGNSKMGRVFQALSDKTTEILDSDDQKAMMRKYQNALARYVKANGEDASIFADNSSEARNFLSVASDYAVHQAEEAAFHQNDDWSNALSRAINVMKGSDQTLAKGFGTLADAAIPFKKTPANVLRSCIEYSPLEYLNAFWNVSKLKSGEISSPKFIDNIAKATTGTGMYVLGGLLSHAGIIRIGSNKGTKEKNTDTRTGVQNGAVYIGGHNFDLSDLAPAAYPLIAGATFQESFKNENDFWTAITKAIGSSASSLVDTTMLMGINNILETVKYADQDESGITSVGKAVAESYAGQFLPTLGRAINSTVDDTQRSSYSSKTGVGKEVESTAKYLETKIPGLQQVGDWADKNNIPVLNKLKLQPAIDAWGNVKKQNSAGVDAYTDDAIANTVGRGVANLATPTKLSADKSTDLDNKIRELKESVVSNGDLSPDDADNLFPYTATSEARIDNKKLSEKDWTDYQIKKGKTSKDLAQSLLTSGKYDDLSDADKADILPKLYSFAKANTAADYGGNVSATNAKLMKAYKSGGAEAVIDSVIGSSEKSSFTSAVQASNSEGKASIDNVIDYLNAVEKKDPAQAKELASQASEYQSGTYKKQSGKWVYQNKNTTKTGTGKAVAIPGPDEVGLPKASTKASTKSTETVPDMSSKLSEVRKNKDKAIAAIKKGESADSAVVNAGYWANRNYESRYSKYSSAKIPGLSKSEENFKLIYQTMDSDRNGNLKKKEVVDYINSQNLTAAQKRAMFSAFANKNWKNPY